MTPRPDLRKRGDKTRDRILEVIVRSISGKGIPPTIREIRVGSGLKSESTVEYHLAELEKEGKIIRLRGISRGIVLANGVQGVYDIDYKCLYPFGCKEHSDRPGTCKLHGVRLIPFVTRKR